MNRDFEEKVRGAGVAGWWTVLVSAAIVTLQWLVYLLVMAWRPALVLSLWGSSGWPEVQHVWLVGTAFLKIFVGCLAVVSLWLTLWARELRRAAGA
jgi:hypothetical protein